MCLKIFSDCAELLDDFGFTGTFGMRQAVSIWSSINGHATAFLAMAGIALIGTLGALRLWPASDPDTVGHVHDDSVSSASISSSFSRPCSAPGARWRRGRANDGHQAHLSVLARPGLIVSERQTRSIVYRADLNRLRSLATCAQA